MTTEMPVTIRQNQTQSDTIKHNQTYSEAIQAVLKQLFIA